jgi:hypothetical protein
MKDDIDLFWLYLVFRIQASLDRTT